MRSAGAGTSRDVSLLHPGGWRGSLRGGAATGAWLAARPARIAPPPTLAGKLGTQAPATVAKLDQAIKASKALGEVPDERVETAAEAWERYLLFKRVIRQAYGKSSKQYQRIHIRDRPPPRRSPPPRRPQPRQSPRRTTRGEQRP